jgi:hypothetical protein
MSSEILSNILSAIAIIFHIFPGILLFFFDILFGIVVSVPGEPQGTGKFSSDDPQKIRFCCSGKGRKTSKLTNNKNRCQGPSPGGEKHANAFAGLSSVH